MEVRGRLALVGLALVLSAACQPGDGRDQTKPTILVEVRDRANVAVDGIDVLSTFEGQVIDVVVTSAGGRAKIAVVAGGELTAFRRDGYHVGITTLVAVRDDVDQTIPIERSDDEPPLDTLSMVVSSSGGLTGSARVGAGNCARYGSFGATLLLEIHPACTQSDGTVSVTALALTSADLVAGVGLALDLPVQSGTHAVLVVPTSQAVATDVSLSISGGATDDYWIVAGVRKGREIGPEAVGSFAVSTTARLFGISEAATAVRAAAITGIYPFDGNREIRQRTSFGPIAFDTATWPAGSGIDMVEENGQLFIEIVDPGPQGTSTEIQLYWNDGDVVSHNWFLVAPPPASAGTRRIPVPPVPESLRDLVLDFDIDTSFKLTYFDADWIEDYRNDPLRVFSVPDGEWTLKETVHGW